MSNWKSGDVIVNGLKLHYTRTGGEKPPLVMVHGYSDNGLCWTRVARILEEDYDLIMYDVRGHGLSDDAPEGGESEGMVHDAAGLIEALDLDRPGMMGHSMGAAITAGTAAFYPDLLSYIILEDVPWWADAEAQERWHQRSPEQPGEEPQTREEWVAFCRRRSPHWHEDEVQPWADAKMQFSEHEELDLSIPLAWQEIARKITCPALLITGDPEEGAIVAPEVAQEALELMPQAELAHIEGASHNIRRSQFEAYMEAIQDFLAAQREA
ncbi:MAG: alpha/beta fold hydrolase [Anaerolineales bacterium]